MSGDLKLAHLVAELEGRCADPWGYLVMTASQAHQILTCTSPDQPAWTPFLGPLTRSAGANPDTIYGVSRIDPSATYRISGFAGNAAICDILAISGLGGLQAKQGPTVTTIDLTAHAADKTGAIEVFVGPPGDGFGSTVHLDPSADHLWLRQVAHDWAGTVDARVAIERIGGPTSTPVEPVQPRQIRTFVENYVRLWNRHVDGLCSRGLVNSLELAAFTDRTGTVKQSYYQGAFELKADEAIVLTCAPPEDCRYWGIQITDRSYVTPDWRRHQCSLNLNQADLSADGRATIVVSPTDPGCANWLDTAGLLQGTILGRWVDSSAHPLPTLRVLPLGDVAAEVDQAVRQPVLQGISRSAASQLRRLC